MTEKKGTSKKAAATKAGHDGHDEVTEAQSVSMYLTIGLVIGALIVGMAIGYAVAPRAGGLPEATSPAGGGSAPALSPEQLKENLPPDHPQIPAPGSETSETGSPTEEKPANPESGK